MINIYGPVKSSASRCYWALEEVGQEYTTIPVDMQNKEHKSESFLQMNPNGKIPVMDDNGTIVWESFAINHYLAETYKPELLGSTPEARAHVRQWDAWTITSIMHPFYILMDHAWGKIKQDPVLEHAKEELAQALGIIDAHMAKQPYLVGDHFTIADLNLASILANLRFLQMDLESYPNAKRYVELCTSRPAYQKIHAT